VVKTVREWLTIGAAIVTIEIAAGQRLLGLMLSLGEIYFLDSTT